MSFEAGVTKSLIGETRNFADSASLEAFALFVENYELNEIE